MTKKTIAFSQTDTTRDMFIVSMLPMAVSLDDGFADELFSSGSSEENLTRRREVQGHKRKRNRSRDHTGHALRCFPAAMSCGYMRDGSCGSERHPGNLLGGC